MSRGLQEGELGAGGGEDDKAETSVFLQCIYVQ